MADVVVRLIQESELKTIESWCLDEDWSLREEVTSFGSISLFSFCPRVDPHNSDFKSLSLATSEVTYFKLVNVTAEDTTIDTTIFSILSLFSRHMYLLLKAKEVDVECENLMSWT